ncbi:DNA helicase MCM8, partial [Geodia barretti]
APLDYATLIADEVLLGSIPSLPDLIQNQPETTLNCMALALHTVLTSMLQSESQRERDIEGEGEKEGEEECSVLLPSHSPTDSPPLHIRLFNYNPITLLKNVKAPLYGKLVCVQGTVVRAGNIRPLVTRIAFQCLSCHGTQVLSLPDGKYTVPVSCPEPECRGRQFSPLRT